MVTIVNRKRRLTRIKILQASIAAIYQYKTDKILFYLTKNVRMFAYVQFLL